MNGITILIWITIALIAVISIIVVKLHFKGDQLEHEEGSILPSGGIINGTISASKDRFKPTNSNSSGNAPRSLSPTKPQHSHASNLFRNEPSAPKDDAYIVPEVENKNVTNYEYESQNQVLINYDNTVEKFQEPIKQSQMDIMNQNKNNDEDTTELKDLFTIDELIKESKRKDSEREKESQTIRKDEDDDELNSLKQSIKEKKENKSEEPLIEEIIEEDEKEETIGDLIKDTSSDEEEIVEEAEPIGSTSQKEIDEVITTASEEQQKEIESVSEKEEITESVMPKEEEQKTLDEISEPTLKTPNKVDKRKDYELGASIDDANLFGENNEDGMDLDYRKDLNKMKNKITGSKLFQDVKERIVPEKTEEIPPRDDETYIRNVNEYDEYEPIINETHIDYEEEFEQDYEQRLREENTRRLVAGTRKTQAPRPPAQQQKAAVPIKNKPARDNIKIQLNNNEVVLKKGDEIIFNHQGETYSSKVFAINGDDISVKYRRKNIKIKPSDVKKIY